MHKPTQQIALNILTGLILLSHPAANASAQDLSAQVNLDLQAHIQPSKKSVAGPSKLHPLIAQSLKSQKISGSPSPLVVSDEQNKIQVYLKIDALDDSKLETLSGMGVDIDLALDHLNKVQVWAAADAIDELVKVDWVLKITPPNYATPRRGSVTTQGDAILRSNLLRNLGVTGKGIKVGIISDGANNWTSARATGNLPATIQRFGSCQTRANNPSSCLARLTCNEGTAMAEIIHDIAPDAQLAVAGARTSLEFIQRINQLRNTFGADIIVDDLGFFGEPFFADGDIAQAVNSLPASILYFTSAGNSGNSHYQANYNSTISNGVDVHDFGGDDISHGFVVGANSYTLVLVQ